MPGVTWQEKIESLRAEMMKQNVDGVVVSALDESAWLFNLRGYDVPYEPVLLSYAFVTLSNITLFAEADKITAEIHHHLSTDGCNNDLCVRCPFKSFF